MTIGKNFTIYAFKRGVGGGKYSRTGKIVDVQRRYLTVQFKNFRESFLIVDVENNIEHDFKVG